MVESPRAEAKKIPVNRTRQSKLMLDNWHKQTQSQDQRGSCSVIETNALWNCKEKSGEQFISLPTSQQNIKLELVKNVKSGSVLSKFGKIKAVQEKQRFPTQDYQRMILRQKKRSEWKKATLVYKENGLPEKLENSLKVLIVEDNSFNIVPIKSTLEKNHIEYDVAKNGLMAVDRYNQIMSEGSRYGVILMDLEMPMMNGYEATEKIRISEKLHKYPKTYICGLSASTDKGTEERCLQCGMDNYVSKPLNMDQMLKLIWDQFNSLKKK